MLLSFLTELFFVCSSQSLSTSLIFYLKLLLTTSLIFYFFIICLSSILRSSSVSHSPLEVGLGIGLDKGVDGSNPALGSMVGRWVVRSRGRWTVWRCISSHSVDKTILPVVKDENPAC